MRKKSRAKASLKSKSQTKKRTITRKIAKPLSKKVARRIIGRPKPVRLRETVMQAIAPEAQPDKAVESKYYPRPTPYLPPRQWEREELPLRYGDTRIVLLVRDPHWMHAYWEITDDARGRIEQETNTKWENLRKVLRIYDVTGINFVGTNSHKYFDIDLTAEAVNWYIHVEEANRSWCIDLGAIAPKGRFILIARSNIVTTPREGISDVIDEEWMSIEEEFLKLYGLFGGFGLSSPQMVQIRKKISERLQKELASGAISSVGSLARPLRERGFWLIVNTELIVYGATDPSATVTVQGRPIKLNRDGTFSLRFALPDGEQVIPVKGISADKEEERTITPIVRKFTK